MQSEKVQAATEIHRHRSIAKVTKPTTGQKTENADFSGKRNNPISANAKTRPNIAKKSLIDLIAKRGD